MSDPTRSTAEQILVKLIEDGVLMGIANDDMVIWAADMKGDTFQRVSLTVAQRSYLVTLMGQL